MLRISSFLEPLPHGRRHSRDEHLYEAPSRLDAGTGSSLDRCPSVSARLIVPQPAKQAGPSS